jgi:nitrogen regulatory protein P-II 2
MKTVPLKLVTIVAEAVLEDRLLRELAAAGARGHTVSTARGRGSRGVRASDWEGGNVRIEVLAADEVSDRVLDLLADRYFPHYAVVAWVERVEVVRGDKYV